MAKEQAPTNPPQLTLIPDPVNPEQLPLITGGFTPLDNPFPNGLSGAELAARLGVNPSTISRNGKWDGAKFSQWAKLSREEFKALYPNEPISAKSQKHPDPDGLAWEKRGDRFFPVG